MSTESNGRPCRSLPPTNAGFSTCGHKKISEGKGKLSDINKLEEIAWTVKNGSLCGLGRTAANPVLTTMKYFLSEYETHIKKKKCVAKVCKALLTYTIDQKLCTACGKCKKECAVDAIAGEKKIPHSIDQNKCSKCGHCFDVCSFNAIFIE